MGFLARRRFRRGRAYAAASSSGAGPPASDRASVPPRPNVAYLRRPSSDEDRLPTIFAALGIALVKDREQDGRSAAFTTSCSRRSGRFGLPARAFSNRARGSRAPRGSPKRPCSAAGLRAKARARSARRPSNGWRSLGGESRRRRGCTVDIPWKRFAATSRGDAAAASRAPSAPSDDPRGSRGVAARGPDDARGGGVKRRRRGPGVVGFGGALANAP